MDTPEIQPHILIGDQFFINEKGILHRVVVEDVSFLHQENHHTVLQLENGKRYITHTTFTSWLEFLQGKKFIQVHKSYIVNLQKLTALSNNKLTVDGHEIPIGDAYHDDVFGSHRIVSGNPIMPLKSVE